MPNRRGLAMENYRSTPSPSGLGRFSRGRGNRHLHQRLPGPSHQAVLVCGDGGKRPTATNTSTRPSQRGRLTPWPTNRGITALRTEVLYVEKTREVLLSIASHYRDSFDLKVVGSPAAWEKPPPKEFIWTVLSAKYHTLKTWATRTTEVGLPQTIFRLERATRPRCWKWACAPSARSRS